METKNDIILLHNLWHYEYQNDASMEYLDMLENAVQRLYYQYGHQYETSTVEILEPVETIIGTVHGFRVIPPRSSGLNVLRMAFVL